MMGKRGWEFDGYRIGEVSSLPLCPPSCSDLLSLCQEGIYSISIPITTAPPPHLLVMKINLSSAS